MPGANGWPRYQVMKILAADIGGTNARFAEVEIAGLSQITLSEPVVFTTWSVYNFLNN